MWTWTTATLGDVGFSPILEVRVADANQGPPCTVNLAVTNEAPVILCPGSQITVQTGDNKTQTVAATDDCDVVSFSITDLGGATGAVTLVGGSINYAPSEADGGLAQPVIMTVEATDGHGSSSCTIVWNVITGAPYLITLGAADNNSSGVIAGPAAGIPGAFNEIHIGISGIDVIAGLGGFDFRIRFDASALAFQ